MHVLEIAQRIQTLPPQEALGTFSQLVRASSSAVDLAVYFLNLRNGRFELVSEERDWTIPHVPAPPLPDGEPSSPMDRAVTTRTTVLEPIDRDSEWGILMSPKEVAFSMVIPAVRAQTCLGFIVAHYRSYKAAKSDQMDLEFCSSYLVDLYERRFISRRFAYNVGDIDLDLPLDTFLDSVADTSIKAAGMEFLALRQLSHDQNTLETVRLRGFADVDSLDEFSFTVDQPGTGVFWNVVRTLKPGTVADLSQEAIEMRELVRPVLSYVCVPVITGGRLWGTLSIASRTPFQYTEIEVMGFASLGIGIGMALFNQEQFQTRAESKARMRQLGLALTSVQLARSVRHEVRLYIDNAQLRFNEIGADLEQRRPSPRRQELIQYVNDLSSDLQHVQIGIEQILKPLQTSEEMSWVSLGSIWEDALGMARGKLNQLRVAAPTLVGRDVLLRAYPNHVRTALANLILNSIDAFDERRVPLNQRKITFSCPEIPDRAGVGQIEYTDTAGGLNEAALRLKGLELGISPEATMSELLFAEEVTTKPNGSGYGLPLVRYFLQD